MMRSFANLSKFYDDDEVKFRPDSPEIKKENDS